MKIKSLLIGILIGIAALPTLAMGSSLVSSLIAGKTPDEAVTILAGQMDALIDRVKTVETEQVKQEEIVSDLQSTSVQQEQSISELQAGIQTLQIPQKIVKEYSPPEQEPPKSSSNEALTFAQWCQIYRQNPEEALRYWYKSEIEKLFGDLTPTYPYHTFNSFLNIRQESLQQYDKECIDLGY